MSDRRTTRRRAQYFGSRLELIGGRLTAARDAHRAHVVIATRATTADKHAEHAGVEIVFRSAPFAFAARGALRSLIKHAMLQHARLALQTLRIFAARGAATVHARQPEAAQRTLLAADRLQRGIDEAPLPLVRIARNEFGWSDDRSV